MKPQALAGALVYVAAVVGAWGLWGWAGGVLAFAVVQGVGQLYRR